MIPGELEVTFNIRIDNSKNHEEFEAMINRWCKEAGEGVYLEFKQKDSKVENTVLDEKNIFWRNFKSACDRLNMNIELVIMPGATDSRYIRLVCK